MKQIIHSCKYYCPKIKPNRTLIIPEQFTTQPLQQHFHITSKNYDFLTPTSPPFSQIYTHSSDSPSNLLKKPAIHIFPQSVTQQTLQEKYRAFLRKLEEQYVKAYDKCTKPAEVFHMERRIKTEIWGRCRFIGRVVGKYKHYNLFKSINDLNSEKTLQQYKKNGLQIPILSTKIYPTGPIWLPTTDTYLHLFNKYLLDHTTIKPSTILDLGCGSGVLSFILGKFYKSAAIFAVDCNRFAVETCALNAVGLGLGNVVAVEADVTDLGEFRHRMNEKKAPAKFDLIVANPPWLIAKRTQNQTQILDGVYDNKSTFLISTFTHANTLLKDKSSRLLLIYSNLSQILGIQVKTIDQLCKENNFLVHSKLEAQYPRPLDNGKGRRESRLGKYKMGAKVFLYEIGRC